MIRLLLLLAALLGASAAQAHLTPNSEMTIDIGQSRVRMALVIPMGELGYAGVRGRSPEALSAWLLGHLAISSPDGRRWRATVAAIAISDDAAPDLRATVDLLPPPGASPRAFTLNYDGVIDRVPNHFVLVVLKSDFEAGHLNDQAEMLGGLRQGATALTVDRGPGSAWRGFVSAVGLGIHHIAEGHDHLLFLIALLLPAPLLALKGRGWPGRWGVYAGLRPTLVSLGWIVTAFTIGHSATLIGGAFFGWTLPSRPVESLIALSILISAVHAWRPLFAGREPVVAGLFGLVHGLAFATLIGRFGLEPLQKAQSILGFNIGIELVQMLVVLLVTPGLVALARTRAYPAFRTVMATLAGAAAAIWLSERAVGWNAGAGAAIDRVMDYAGWALAAFALMSTVLLAWESMSPRRGSSA